MCATHSILGILLNGNAIAPRQIRMEVHPGITLLLKNCIPSTNRLSGASGPGQNKTRFVSSGYCANEDRYC